LEVVRLDGRITLNRILKE